MDKYLAYWKRGWWAWLLMLCANILLAILIFPLAMAFRGNENIYWLSAAVMWFVIVAPLWGWLFEYFAAGSTRIVEPKNSSANDA